MKSEDGAVRWGICLLTSRYTTAREDGLYIREKNTDLTIVVPYKLWTQKPARIDHQGGCARATPQDSLQGSGTTTKAAEKD